MSRRSWWSWSRLLGVAGSTVGACELVLARGGSLCEEEPGEKREVKRPSQDHYRYVVCGFGTAAQEATRALLEQEPSASMLIVSEELRAPFHHSPLWRWYRGKEALGADSDQFLRDLGFRFNRGMQECVLDRVVSLDVRNNEVLLGSGSRVKYDQCLVALGGCTDVPPWGGDGVVIDGRSTEGQLHLLRKLQDGRRHVTIVGGGWIACYMAGILSTSGAADVTMIFPESAPLARFLPKYLTDYVSAHLKAHKVEMLPYRILRWVQPRGEEAEVFACRVYDSAEVTGILTDSVVLAPTTVPACTESGRRLSEDGLLRENSEFGGIDCGPELLAASNVYVAGDIIARPQIANQSQWNALGSGRTAALNMCGDRIGYSSRPIYKADIPVANAHVVCVGEVNPEAETYGYFASKARKHQDHTRSGVVFYIKPKSAKICGIVLWNCDDSSADTALALLGHDLVDRSVLATRLQKTATRLIREEDQGLPLVHYVRQGRANNKGTSIRDREQLWDSKPRSAGGSAAVRDRQNFRNLMEGVQPQKNAASDQPFR